MGAEPYKVIAGPGVPKGMVIAVNPGSIIAWMGTVKDYIALGSIDWVDGTRINLNPLDYDRLKVLAEASGEGTPLIPPHGHTGGVST